MTTEVLGGAAHDLAAIDESVQISEFQANWTLMFAKEQQRLCQALDVSSEDIEHIGSTAVPNLSAKPTVDLMLGVSSFPPSPAFLNSVGQLGWEAMGEGGVSGRLYFRMRRGVQANLHVVLKNDGHWNNNLAIREYLRSNAGARERYASAKSQALASGASTLLLYSAAKAEFVRQLLHEALTWSSEITSGAHLP